MEFSIVSGTDSYKMTHPPMYLPGTEYVYAYFEARRGAMFDYTVFAGLQPILMDYLEGVVVTKEKIDKAEILAAAHFGNPDIFNRERWDYIIEKHGGKLPVRIKAVAEGTPVTVNNVMMTIENTDPKCWWLTNHLETIVTHVWYMSTVATLSRQTKETIANFLEKTAESDAGLPFMLHDFGFRGATGVEAAGAGGAGHLINFMGTDTVRAIEHAMFYYDAEVCGFSVPATEHSIMTSKGPEGEVDVIENLLDQFPTGYLSVVIDSYNAFETTEKIIAGKFKERILARDGVFVVRPDSGEPISTILRLLEILEKGFGADLNTKGYKVLNPKVRLIWGDGLDKDMIHSILRAITEKKWSVENLVFGMGGGLLQKVNRDTQRFAFKCSAQRRDGVWYDICKEPLDKTKASKKGRLSLFKTLEGYTTGREGSYKGDDLLQTVFENGEIKKRYTFDEVRKNAEL